jgi:DNA-binding NtrC family response regulator
MPSTKPASVLIVEDEWLIAESLQETLENAGFLILGPVGRVSDALKLIETNGLRAAVLDVSLRGENSFPIARALAERLIPFAFMTGYVSKDILDSFRDRPILNKPVDEDRLIACVTELVNASFEPV